MKIFKAASRDGYALMSGKADGKALLMPENSGNDYVTFQNAGGWAVTLNRRELREAQDWLMKPRQPDHAIERGLPDPRFGDGWGDN